MSIMGKDVPELDLPILAVLGEARWSLRAGWQSVLL